MAMCFVCCSDMHNMDWAGSSGTSTWVSHGGAGSQTEPAASTQPGYCSCLLNYFFISTRTRIDCKEKTIIYLQIYIGGSSFMGAPSFDDTSMDWTGSGSTGEASAIADAENETIPLPLSPGKQIFFASQWPSLFFLN